MAEQLLLDQPSCRHKIWGKYKKNNYLKALEREQRWILEKSIQLEKGNDTGQG